MARVSLVQTNQGPLNYYNVDGPVGPNCLNRRDDVLLVQYFLTVAFESDIFANAPFEGDMKIDGQPGPVTFAAISHFQNVQRKRGKTIATDGRVDPPTGENIRGTISNTQYTILFLNFAYADERSDDWPAVSEASDCPTELKPKLKEPKFIGEE